VSNYLACQISSSGQLGPARINKALANSDGSIETILIASLTMHFLQKAYDFSSINCHRSGSVEQNLRGSLICKQFIKEVQRRETSKSFS
jgi:hypothetical protein